MGLCNGFLRSEMADMAYEKGIPMKIEVITREGQMIEIAAEAGDPLMYSLRDAGLVEAMCGGQAACATCHVFIASGWTDRVGRPDGQEEYLLDSSLERLPNSRLSCQVVLDQSLDNLQIAIAPAEG